MAKIVTIIPAYNEAGNVEKMIGVLSEVLPEIKKHDVSVLFVDANSPDGTADLVRKYQKKYKWISLLVETKKSRIRVSSVKDESPEKKWKK